MTQSGHQGAARSVLAIASSFRRATPCLLANRFRKSPVKKLRLLAGPANRSCVRLLLSERWFSLCVTGEDKVARFDLIVAGEAGFHERLVARFAILEVSEAPTARCGVLFCVLDHKLNVRWGAGYERLGLAKDFVVFLRRHVTVMQSGDDRAVWERDLPFR
jgi:hypothetical protein